MKLESVKNNFRTGVYDIAHWKSEPVQFFAGDFEELKNLWEDYCDGNGLDYNNVGYVGLAESDLDIFERYLERTGDSLYKLSIGYVLCTIDGEKETVYETWADMIRYMCELTRR